MYLCACTKVTFHSCFRISQAGLLILTQILLKVISDLLYDYQVQNSKMVFNDSKIVIGGMTQLNAAMLVAALSMSVLNCTIVCNSEQTVTMRNDTVVQPKSSTGGLGGLLMNIFINLCTMIAGLIALTAEGVALMNRYNEDVIEYNRLCDSLRAAALETCVDRSSEQQRGNFMLGLIVFFAGICLIIEILKILLDIFDSCRESGKGCNLFGKVRINYESLPTSEKKDQRPTQTEMIEVEASPAIQLQPNASNMPEPENQLELPQANDGTLNRPTTQRLRQRAPLASRSQQP